jgi:FkbM family methyltransferase
MKSKILNFVSFRLQLIVDYLQLRKWLTIKKISLKYRLESSDIRVFRQIFLEEVYHFFPAGYQPKTIIDAGANVGFSSVWFARQFPGATIYALEPEKSNFQILARNSIPFPMIRPLPFALWSSDTELSVHDPGNGSWGFEMKEIEGNALSKTVKGYSGAGLWKLLNLSTVDLMKVDIEGAEYELFSSSDLSWVDKVTCFMLETHERKRKGVNELIDRILEDRGYKKFVTRELSIYLKC